MRPGLASGVPCANPLDTYVLGPENRLVELAVESVLHDTNDGYSPIVLCGPPGTGKSHLAWGLAAAWRARFPKRARQYVSAVDFARELADATQTKTVDDFRLRYRRLALLVVEDLEHLVGKSPAQRELAYTLDALQASDSHVVITANRSPGELSGLAPGLQSRLAGGLVVRLARPDRQTRLAILERAARSQGLDFPDRALDLLADTPEQTVPELLGAVTELAFSARADGTAIEMDRVRQYVAQKSGARRPALGQIASVTARHFGLRATALRGPSRRRPAPTARALAMYLARNLTNQSLEQIGHYFGGRDHTTVSYSCRKTEERLRAEPEIREAASAIQETLQEP